MKAKKKRTYSVTRENSRTGRSVTKTRSADGTKTKTVSKSPLSFNKVGQKKTKSKIKSADGSKSKTSTRTVGQNIFTGKGSRRYLAGTEITKKKTKSADGSRSKSKEIKNPTYTGESEKRIKKLGLESEYMKKGGKVKKTVYGSMQKGGVLKDEEGNIVAKEGGKIKKAKGGMKMYKKGGRRKKGGSTLLERTFYGRKKAAKDRREKIDRGIARLNDPEKEPSRTVVIAKDPKDEAKLQRKKMRLDAVRRRRSNRRSAKAKAKRPGKGLGAQRQRKLAQAVKDMQVDNRKAFFEEQKKIREENRPKVDTSGLFKKK